VRQVIASNYSGVQGQGSGNKKKMNIERPTSNFEWEKMKKQTYDLEERLAKANINQQSTLQWHES
jgi:hypothetical protein